ncbi:MAG: pirin family protein [Myxococcales bacterium]|nr:pirin family protein [Myxococcales bacterium]MCB9578397.1 pirin family protein [Polyangiaceae bacterium]
MTITVRHGSDRGRSELPWLDSRHSFSFADYYDPAHMGFRALRVINDDRVAPAKGFGTHPHRDMEILSYVLEGELAHRDSMGNGSTIRPGEIQRMSAGSGVLHSEMNPSPDTTVRFLQIWIVPDKRGGAPGYEQRPMPPRDGRLALVASSDGREGSVKVQQDVSLYSTVLEAEQNLTWQLPPGRFGWIQVARGTVRIGDQLLEEGDGAQLEGVTGVDVKATERAELLLFDLA